MQPAAPRPASTVVLLRPGGTGAEVLLMRRHGASPFLPGATVFPGGKVDPADAEAPCTMDPAECARRLGQDGPAARATYLSAIRELHEEAGVLLARDADGRAADPAAAAALARAIEPLRDGHRLAAQAWWDALADLRLVAAPEALSPFVRWVTPDFEPRRFDTFFFVARVPPGHEGRMDGLEATRLDWVRPADALADHEAGGETVLAPPTLDVLCRLQESLDPAGDPEAAIERLVRSWGARGAGPALLPVLVEADGVPALVLPGDPAHPTAPGDLPFRFLFSPDGRFRRVTGPARPARRGPPGAA